MGEGMEMVPVGGDLRHRRPVRLHGARCLAVAAADAILVVCSRKLTERTFGERGAPGA